MNLKLMPLRAFQTLSSQLNGRKIFGKNIGDIYAVECVYENIKKIIQPKDIVTEINGYKLKVNYSMGGIARQIVNEQQYEPLSTKLFIESCQHRKGDVIDIGANIGYYTMLAARLLPNDTVYAFEPEAGNYINLCDNRNINHFTNIKCFPMALSNVVGRAFLYTSNKESGEHNIIGSHGLNKNNAYEVTINTLDNIWYSSQISPVSVIKIDVEGAEYRVIEGAYKVIKQFHPDIFVECWEEGLKSDNRTIEDLFSLLHELGYSNIRMIDEYTKEVYKALPGLIREYSKQHNFSVNLVATVE